MLIKHLERETISILNKDPLFKDKLLPDIIEKDQNHRIQVFPVIRDNRIDFYHEGKKFFSFNKNRFETNPLYIGATSGAWKTQEEARDFFIKAGRKNEFRPFVDNYESIKVVCRRDQSRPEDKGITKLYKSFSCAKRSRQHRIGIVFLDMEIRFSSERKDETSSFIDFALYNSTERKLRFYEAKLFDNYSLYGENPSVIEQISRYRRQLLENKTNIIKQYKKYTRHINSIFDPNMKLNDPLDLDTEPRLLIFGSGGIGRVAPTGEIKRLRESGVMVYHRATIDGIDIKELWEKPKN